MCVDNVVSKMLYEIDNGLTIKDALYSAYDRGYEHGSIDGLVNDTQSIKKYKGSDNINLNAVRNIVR